MTPSPTKFRPRSSLQATKTLNGSKGKLEVGKARQKENQPQNNLFQGTAWNILKFIWRYFFSNPSRNDKSACAPCALAPCDTL